MLVEYYPQMNRWPTCDQATFPAVTGFLAGSATAGGGGGGSCRVEVGPGSLFVAGGALDARFRTSTVRILPGTSGPDWLV